jgi:hypothetical protein
MNIPKNVPIRKIVGKKVLGNGIDKIGRGSKTSDLAL